MGQGFYRFCRFSLRILFRCTGRVETEDVEKMPATGPVIVASNHASYLDPVLLGTYLPRPLHFMARASLFANPLFGRLIGALLAFPVDREGDPRQALRTMGERLSAGHPVLIFPEGTRTTTGALQPLKSGVAMLSTRFRAPILPVYVKGSFESWPRGRRLPRPHGYRILAEDPLIPESATGGTGRKAERERLLHDLEAALRALEQRAWEGETPPRLPSECTEGADETPASEERGDIP